MVILAALRWGRSRGPYTCKGDEMDNMTARRPQLKAIASMLGIKWRWYWFTEYGRKVLMRNRKSFL